MKYEINSKWGLIKIEVEDSKTYRQIVEEFLDTKDVNYTILDEHEYGKPPQLIQFILKINDERDEIELIKR
ncbi:MAG: hypothetical protein J6Y42_02105 [Bacilli bacterium]|nr:hypothetical protein [Bacilli bacterium]